MDDEVRAVLERVARGELNPGEAERLLDELETKSSAPTAEKPFDWSEQANWGRETGAEPGHPSPPPGSDGVKRIRVVRAIGKTVITADPAVREAVADGPHSARLIGDTLLIESDDDPTEIGAFAFGWRGRHRPKPRLRFGDFPTLRIRVNPDLPLDVEAQAGRLAIRGVRAPIRAEVQAGSTVIDGFESPLDLTSQAGSVGARGRLDHGSSRIRCEAGTVRLHLERGSNVRVSAHTTLGKVTLDGGENPWVIGEGSGTLDIEATMGSVRVSADR